MARKTKATVAEEAVKDLRKLLGSGSTETAHGHADDIILQALRDLGFPQIADAWDEVDEDHGGFWYA